ncbi:MarR family transcriptional regulator [Diaphorobacter sp.]|uniref:MarR family winged helix-turn-helix transcriptional regulator n=1 Tax=Diaphorobacter sp. TaxID=1934310 RepID=UPI0028AA3D46|nr:MarR family transcriptional regulator [Diaphorobacter sp.]
MSVPEPRTADQVRHHLMFAMGQLNRQWRRVLDRRLRPLGLTEATWLPLMHLERATEPMRQKDLAASLGLDGSSVVRLLDGLEQAGLIARGSHADRRAKTIDITPEGQAMVTRVKALLHDDRRQLFDGIGDAELVAAYAVIGKIGAQLERFDALDGEPA